MYPPQQVADPVQAGILDHGRTASLIVEVPGGGMVRYAYGDWTWYALDRTGPVEGSAALLWRSEAALGRMELPGPFSPAAVAREVRVGLEDTLYLTVDARDVRRLVDHLDRIFEENRARSVYNETHHLVFVPHPEPYSMFHNSNHMVAAWLEQLGCRVEGPALLSSWRRGADPTHKRGHRGLGIDRGSGGQRSSIPRLRHASAFHSSGRSSEGQVDRIAQGPGSTRAPTSPKPVGAAGSTAPNQVAAVAPGQPVLARSAAPDAAGPVRLGR